MRLLVTGSRRWTDHALLWNTLDELYPLPEALAQGYARGADYLARSWALRRGVPNVDFFARWYPNGQRDLAAGRKRNERMLHEFEPDYVLAFKDGFDFALRRGGTEHMCLIALAEGVTVDLISHDGKTRLTSPQLF